HGLIFCFGTITGRRHIGGVRLTRRLFYNNIVFQASFFSKLLLYRFTQQTYIMFFQPFVEEQTWYLYRQDASFHAQGLDWFEPSLITLRRDVVFNDLKAAIPNVCTSFIHIYFIKILILTPSATNQ